MRLEALSDFLVTILWGDKVRRYTILEHLNMTSIDGPGVSSIFMAELLHRLEMYAFEMALQPFLHRCERGTSLHSCFSYTHTYLPATPRVVEKRGVVAFRFSLVCIRVYLLTHTKHFGDLSPQRARGDGNPRRWTPPLRSLCRRACRLSLQGLDRSQQHEIWSYFYHHKSACCAHAASRDCRRIFSNEA